MRGGALFLMHSLPLHLKRIMDASVLALVNHYMYLKEAPWHMVRAYAAG